MKSSSLMAKIASLYPNQEINDETEVEACASLVCPDSGYPLKILDKGDHYRVFLKDHNNKTHQAGSPDLVTAVVRAMHQSMMVNQ
jgi:hypothetical protein